MGGGVKQAASEWCQTKNGEGYRDANPKHKGRGVHVYRGRSVTAWLFTNACVVV